MKNDSEIISLCLSGDIDAFGMIVKKYQEPILFLSWSILRDREESREASQEAFTKAYLNLDSYDLSKNFKNWLTAIAYRICLDKYRQKRSFRNLLKRIPLSPLFNSQETRNQHIKDADEIFDIALSRLNREERVSILLKHKEGYTAGEIAQILSCAESTVRVYLLNARNKLKSIIKEKNLV